MLLVNIIHTAVTVKRIIDSKRAHKARMQRIQETHDRVNANLDEIFKNLGK